MSASPAACAPLVSVVGGGRVRVIPTNLERWLPAAVIVGGRVPARLIVSDPTISASHLEIRWDGRDWVARGLKSDNGIWIDGRRLPPFESRPLRVGAVISLAKVQHALEVLDVQPPVPFAEHLRTGEQRVGGELGMELPHGLVQHTETLGWVLKRDGEDPIPLVPVPTSPTPSVITDQWRLENLDEHPVVTQRWLNRPLGSAQITLLYDVKRQHTGMTLEWDDRDRVELPPRAEIYVFMVLVRELRSGKSRVLTSRIHERTGVHPDSIPTYTNRLRRSLRQHAVADWESLVIAEEGFLHTAVDLDRIVEVKV